MMKFTKEEISLCKQVAEKYRNEVKEGSYLSFIDKIWLVYHITGPWISTISNGAKHTISTNLDNQDEWFPLWTISDCLEFLEKEGYGRIIGFIHFDNGRWTFTTENSITSNNYKKARGEKANTKLEACLKAVLEILK